MSKYYDPNDKIVFDGDVAEARDVNDVNTSTAAGFDLVEADINNIGNIGEEWAIEAREWAISPTQPEPGYESSRTYSIRAGDSATDAAVSAAEAAVVEANVIIAEQNAANCAAEAKLSAGEAGDKVTECEQYATDAAQSASAAAASANDAKDEADRATVEADRSTTQADRSETEADRSEAGALESYHWANMPEDTQVPESQNPPEYSAYHWMKKAEAIAGGDFVLSVAGLAPITVDNTDTQNPIVGWAGDKTDVGLGNVDNTADINKPVSAPQQAAIDAGDDQVRTEFQAADAVIITNYEAADTNLQNQIDAITGGGIVEGVTSTPPITVDNTDPANPIIGWAGDKTDVGLDQVDNTSDLDKPISTDTQTALNAKENFLGNPAQDGQVLASTAAGVRSWVTGGGGGGGGLTWTLTAVDVAVAHLEGKMVDTSAGPITITIPDNPDEGDIVGIMDAFGDAETNNITIASLQFIMGDTEDMTIASNNMALRLVYSGDAQYGWRVETLTPCGGGGSTGGGGLEWQQAQGFDFASENGKGYPMFDGCTMTLPAAPEDNDQIGWKDWNNAFDQVPCFIDPNGNNIEQLGSGVMELNTKGQGGTLVWITDRWLIVDVTEIGTEPEPQGVKKVQRLSGNLALSSNITITIDEVDLNKTFLNITGWLDQGSGGGRYYAELISSTEVYIRNIHNVQSWDYRIEVVEFY